MDRSRLTPRLFCLISVILTLTGVVLRSICILVSFDASVGYFDKGLLPVLSNTLYFSVVIAAIVCAALMPKGALPTALSNDGRRPMAYLLGLLLAAFTLGVLLTCYRDRTNDFLKVPTVLGVLSSLYFFVTGNRNGRFPDGVTALGFLPVAWCIAAAWETYTDQFTAINSPLKIGLQLGFLGLAFILISELRFRLGKPLPRFAAALTAIGLFCTLNGSIPVLVGIGAGILDSTLYFLYASVLLCGGLYGAVMLLRSISITQEPSLESAPVESDDAPTAPSTDSPNAE